MNKLISILLIITSIILFIVIYSFTINWNKSARLLCEEICSINMTEQVCPHAKAIPWQSYVGFTFSLIILAIGIFLFFKKEERVVKVKKVRDLTKDERKIYELLVKHEGTLFQSELVEKSGFNKVKVTRLLDKLEAKQLVERRRRGMTNIVILKKG